MVLIIRILIIIVETNKKACKEKTGKGPRFIKQNIKENVEGTEQSWGHGTRGTSPKIQKKTATWFYVQIQIQTYIAFGEARGGERQLIIGATFRKKGVAIAVWLVGWWKASIKS